MRNYIELPELGEILLEESYVLDIDCHPGSITFQMDFVLTERHAAYHAPKPNEQFCYRRGRLHLEKVTRSLWTGQGAPPGSDLTGELDWGNIDSLLWDDGEFTLEGTWGQMEVSAQGVRVELG